VSNRLSITVTGIDDGEVVTQVENAVRASFEDMALPGSWQVAVKPSRISGRWDFSVHGLDVRHTLSIAVPAPMLPTLIPSRLIESLNRIAGGRLDDATALPVLTLRRAV
jgi:hypothetical protein